MAVNKYIKDRNEILRKGFAAGMQVGMQVASDYITMSLRDPKVVGGTPFGRERIERLMTNSMELDDHFWVAFSDEVEADYVQEEMDAKLREVYGDDLIPFAERYPNVKQYGYNKARKGWV